MRWRSGRCGTRKRPRAWGARRDGSTGSTGLWRWIPRPSRSYWKRKRRSEHAKKRNAPGKRPRSKRLYSAADGVAGESGAGSEVRIPVHGRPRLQIAAGTRRTLVPRTREDDELQAGKAGDTADGRRAGGDGESVQGGKQ